MTVNELIEKLQELVNEDSEAGFYPVVWQHYPYNVDYIETRSDLVVLT